MVSASQDSDRIIPHLIDQSMFVIDAPGPATGQFMLDVLAIQTKKTGDERIPFDNGGVLRLVPER